MKNVGIKSFDELYDKKLTKEDLDSATEKIQNAVKKAIESEK